MADLGRFPVAPQQKEQLAFDETMHISYQKFRKVCFLEGVAWHASNLLESDTRPRPTTGRRARGGALPLQPHPAGEEPRAATLFSTIQSPP
jgi:hypothetical protein